MGSALSKVFESAIVRGLMAGRFRAMLGGVVERACKMVHKLTVGTDAANLELLEEIGNRLGQLEGPEINLLATLAAELVRMRAQVRALQASQAEMSHLRDIIYKTNDNSEKSLGVSEQRLETQEQTLKTQKQMLETQEQTLEAGERTQSGLKQILAVEEQRLATEKQRLDIEKQRLAMALPIPELVNEVDVKMSHLARKSTQQMRLERHRKDKAPKLNETKRISGKYKRTKKDVRRNEKDHGRAKEQLRKHKRTDVEFPDHQEPSAKRGRHGGRRTTA